MVYEPEWGVVLSIKYTFKKGLKFCMMCSKAVLHVAYTTFITLLSYIFYKLCTAEIWHEDLFQHTYIVITHCSN